MFDKLLNVENKYDELMTKLGTAEVQADAAEYRRSAKTLSELEPLVQKFREYKGIEEDIKGAEELVNGNDAEMRELAREELKTLEGRRDALLQELKILLIPKDPNDEKNVILEIRAGAGGDEAALFASDLFRMYGRYAERRGWKLELLSISRSEGGGLKEGIARVSGDRVWSRLKHERGVHRVQRVPETEAQGRIHTSTVTVAVLPEAEEVDVKIEPKELRIDVFRASGPGGQSVNTTDSAVRVTHLPTGLVVQCQDEKSQHKNKARALTILRSRLLEAELARQADERASERRSQVGSGERSEKIRTYNYPQSRVTDHRAGVTVHRLESIVEGDLDGLLDAVQLEMASRAESEALRAV